MAGTPSDVKPSDRVTLRRVLQQDLEEIDRIWRESGHAEHFGLPSLQHTITSAIAEKDGDIIGFGVVKLYAEAVAVLDLKKTKAERCAALEWLLLEAFRACKEQGIEHLHVYVQDAGMERLLVRKFDFKPATGVALVKEF